MQILIVAGGLTPERDVSLRSGRRLAESLREALPDVDVVEADITATTIAQLHDNRPDCVIPMVHGAVGEDGSLRSVFESLHIPFVGSTSAASRIAFDKGIASSLLPSENIPRFVALPHNFFKEMGANAVIDAVVSDLGVPLIVKPLTGGSALGVTKCDSPADLPTALVTAFGYSDTVMIQQVRTGTELALTVIELNGELTALPPVEIVPLSGVYNYDARYTAGATEFFVPARLDSHMDQRVRDFAIRVHTTLGLRDISRTDVIVDSHGDIWFLEANVAPGMTETSLVPQALSAAGMDVGNVFAQLVHHAISR
ncbi:MAG: D-alanine--D-alanine ligase [Candidatus Nanopelagicales bacterium]|nr:D-alanine--D-alanine ligase [Candidatus Nanopelagicales bacterium]MCF8540034.1 D-alanine--D-alanine ligase [Candidatus Nanopelagicales bacterium]